MLCIQIKSERKYVYFVRSIHVASAILLNSCDVLEEPKFTKFGDIHKYIYVAISNTGSLSTVEEQFLVISMGYLAAQQQNQ